jgi:hypothetical protein
MTVSVNDVEYLNTAEAAEYVGVGDVTFRTWRKRFGVKSYTITGTRKAKFFRKSDLDAMKTPRVIPNDD